MAKGYLTAKRASADEILALIEERFSLEKDRDARQIYYWILDIERSADALGRSYYSRRGRLTLIGFLYSARVWLRARVYSASVLTVDDLLDSSGRLKPQKIGGQTVDLEGLLAEIALETKELRNVFEEYAARESQLIEACRQAARERIEQLH